MQAQIKLNTNETKALDVLVDEFLNEQNIIARNTDIVSITRTSGNNYVIDVADKK